MREILRPYLDRLVDYFSYRSPLQSIEAEVKYGHARQKQLHDRLNSTASDLAGRIDEVQSSLKKLDEHLQRSESIAGLIRLPGSKEARYALPLEYQPSLDYRRRWGGTRPPIQPIHDWFSKHEDIYKRRIGRMRALAPQMANVAMKLDDAAPAPAWTEVVYSPFDALALHSIIADFKPRQYLEVGSGITTLFARKAIVDAGLKTRITSIDPKPRMLIDNACDEFIRNGLENCDLSIFDSLEANDILFFDGSHRSFMNSDVTVFFIDVLPRLKPGVIVQIHDVILPYDYSEWIADWYWNEQYMLAVYLMGRMASIEPLFPTCFVCKEAAYQPLLETPFLNFRCPDDFWRGGGAMWFRHIS